MKRRHDTATLVWAQRNSGHGLSPKALELREQDIRELERIQKTRPLKPPRARSQEPNR